MNKTKVKDKNIENVSGLRTKSISFGCKTQTVIHFANEKLELSCIRISELCATF